MRRAHACDYGRDSSNTVGGYRGFFRKPAQVNSSTVWCYRRRVWYSMIWDEGNTVGLPYLAVVARQIELAGRSGVGVAQMVVAWISHWSLISTFVYAQWSMLGKQSVLISFRNWPCTLFILTHTLHRSMNKSLQKFRQRPGLFLDP